MKTEPRIRCCTKSKHSLPLASHPSSLPENTAVLIRHYCRRNVDWQASPTIQLSTGNWKKTERIKERNNNYKHKIAKTQHGETRKITNDVLVPGCGILQYRSLTQAYQRKKRDAKEKATHIHTNNINIFSIFFLIFR